MRFLYKDKRTQEALNIWSDTKDIIMPAFYFWSAGNLMQKSLQGLLQSLLWQILRELPDIVDLPMLSRDLNLIGSWTERRLQTILSQVLDQVQSSYRICFFIDGLDEFDEDDDDLITFVQKLLLKTGVKVCSSSRPHKAFVDAFGHSSKLRLQDLTNKDIQKYVADNFQNVPQLKSMIKSNEYEMRKLKEQIVDRAKGVFLWVSLVVKDQIRGLRYRDSPEQLQERLASLPCEVEGIYRRMLLQIDRVHRQEASCFLQMAIHSPRISILRHSLANYKGLDNMLLSADEFSVEAIVLLCRLTRSRLATTCVGLLEVHESPYQDTRRKAVSELSSDQNSEHLDTNSGDTLSAFNLESEITDDTDHEQQLGQSNSKPEERDRMLVSKSKIRNAKALKFEPDIYVEFVHRTASDFLKNSGPGRDFLEINSPPDFDIEFLYIKVLLGEMKLSITGYIDSYVDVDYVMREVASGEDRTGNAQIKSCDLIDRTMKILDFSRPDWCPSSHWCARWGRLAILQVQEQESSSLSTVSNSRSSSRDSFYSAKDELTTPDHFNTGGLASLKFLSFAVS